MNEGKKNKKKNKKKKNTDQEKDTDQNALVKDNINSSIN
jgi:hypothetical protein